MSIKSIAILFFLIIGMVSCKSSKNDMKKEDITEKEILSVDASSSEEVQSKEDLEDCFHPRKTIRTIVNEEGKMLKVTGVYVIVSNIKGRYQACEIPEEFQKEGMEVTFSGDKLEIYPNERRIATPLRLTNISSK